MDFHHRCSGGGACPEHVEWVSRLVAAGDDCGLVALTVALFLDSWFPGFLIRFFWAPDSEIR
jgi:hypothetical protein